MKVLGVIPARYGSTRFPGKPLAMINGKSMIERVYRQSVSAGCLSKVIVATDDERILSHVTAFGGIAEMTDPNHHSGTDRCSEVFVRSGEQFDVVVNIQGDEPYIQPAQIERVVSCFRNPEVSIATLINKITDSTELANTNIPKVVIDKNGKALYFSRYPVPYCKGSELGEMMDKDLFFKHIGIYAFRGDILPILSGLKQSGLEKAESLEQLRWLYNGYSIYTAETFDENLAVDVPEDILLIESRYRS